MKKRVMMTLSAENMAACQLQLKRLGLPKQALSAVVDDWLGNFAPILCKMADKKAKGEQMSFEEVMGEMFVSLGAAMKP